MPREIKFRVWDGEQMHETSFGRVDGYDGPTIRTDKPLECVWMQYTGLQDSEGTPIYEGDVIGFPNDAPLLVEWDSGMCAFRAVDPTSGDSFSIGLQVGEKGQARVVGNKYQHPHLLEEAHA